MVERVLFIMKMEKLVGTAKTLTDGQQLFVAKISKDLIGIATQRVGLGSTGGFIGVGNTSTILFFTGLGTGKIIVLQQTMPILLVMLTKRTVTVTTDVQIMVFGEDTLSILMLIHHLQQRML